MNPAVATTVSPRAIRLETNPEVVARYLEDAAHYPGGHAASLARPASVEEVAWVVQQANRVLPVGAQSSLTGGATPSGDIILSTERFRAIEVAGSRVRVGAGVRLHDLQDELAHTGWWFPPVPTFLGATVGGAVATNAAGAATFRYGPIRRWVVGLTVVLASGDVLRLQRGDVRAVNDHFVIKTTGGDLSVPVPQIAMPSVPKCSAGYFGAPGMDLIDLFIGSEGTLGVIVEVVLDLAPRPGGVAWMLASLPSETAAIRMAGRLRTARVLQVAAIEHIDHRSIQVLREDGVDRRLGIVIPPDAGVLLLAQIELDAAQAERGMADDGLDELSAMLEHEHAVDSAEIVLPGDARRAAALMEMREAVPAGVNRRVALAHAADARVHKTAADMIVPFESFAAMMDACRGLAAERALDLAVWGHISDGNVHPNVIPRTYADVERGREMIVELARRVVSLGGSPLAEHGVGRNPVKQQLLEMLYGAAGVDSMRRTKLSLDREWKLSAGLVFEMVTSRDAG